MGEWYQDWRKWLIMLYLTREQNRRSTRNPSLLNADRSQDSRISPCP